MTKDAAPLLGIEMALRRRHVSPEIIERVLRLNPDPRMGEVLRGFHYAKFDDPRFTYGALTKGEFLRKFGRDAWNGLQPQHITKRGRRKYVTHAAVQDQVWVTRQ